MTDAALLKKRALAALDSMQDEIIQISSTIHANPEIAFQEFKSAALLCQVLESHGFAVERGGGGLETAFIAEISGKKGGPTIAILAEYDALPELGHACGHNIIGTAAAAAGIALEKIVQNLPGRVIVVGTPAEEGGGGKVIMLQKGVFEGVDAAMMVHPASRTMVDRRSLASMRLRLEFIGKASHAAAAPDDGINALEAVILTFNNVNALRLHLKSDARVHGIITDGGSAANVIPDYAAATFSIRAATQNYANKVVDRVIECAHAAAMATGAKLKHTPKVGYAEMMPNKALAHAFAENWREIGIEVQPVRPTERMGSTDMGNVSQSIPSIHPYIAITSPKISGHTREFAQAANSPAGNDGLMNAAKAMAMTTIDLLTDHQLLLQIKKEFAESSENRSS